MARVLLTAAAFPAGKALATGNYHDFNGNMVVVNPATITHSIIVYDAYRRLVTIYPTHPDYVPGPHRVARRTSRRTYRRRN